MKLRVISFILVCLLALAAMLASNRAKPFMADSSDPRLFNQADYPVCVTVQLPPLQPHPHGINLYPHRSDSV